MSGLLPNVYREAVSMDELRSFAYFAGLPPAQQLCLAGLPSYRYIRQSDHLWELLHAGVLTTGYLAAALGFYEAAAVRRLGLPHSRASHGLLLAAYRRLCEPRYEPECDPHITEAMAAAHNAAVTAKYNACTASGDERQALSPTTRNGADNGAAAAEGWPQRRQLLRRRKKQHMAASHCGLPSANTAATASLAAAVAAQHAEHEERSGISEAAKLKAARYLASAGMEAICCRWGKTQEAASLLALAVAFPGSRLLEVGLCTVEASDLPADWVFEAGSLPPLGASPDAIICHPRPAGERCAHADTTAVGSSSTSISTSTTSSGVGREELAEGLAELTFEQLAGAATYQSTSGGLDNGTRLAWPYVAFASTEAAMYEVVEVKNTCPFGIVQHRHRRGRRYVVCDRGPSSQVHPQWVPQLQLQMLCAGTRSALLASRSATRGMRIFRMQRDHEYLLGMLGIVQRLWREYVLMKQQPPKDVFAHLPEHQALMRRNKELAAGAELVAEVDGSAGGVAGRGSDARFFLDGTVLESTALLVAK